MKKLIEVNSKKDYFLLILTILLVNGFAFIIGKLTQNSNILYNSLIKPTLAPPDWVFPVVWTILYLLMAIGFYRILMLKKQGNNVNYAILLFSFQLILNYLWSILFFYLGSPFLALIDLCILILFIILTIISFYKLDKIATYLLIPYIFWCMFAVYLNYSIFMLN